MMRQRHQCRAYESKNDVVWGSCTVSPSSSQRSRVSTSLPLPRFSGWKVVPPILRGSEKAEFKWKLCVRTGQNSSQGIWREQRDGGSGAEKMLETRDEVRKGWVYVGAKRWFAGQSTWGEQHDRGSGGSKKWCFLKNMNEPARPKMLREKHSSLTRAASRFCVAASESLAGG